MFSGVSRGLKLIDSNETAANRVVVWKRDHAHADLKSNPMVPYWVASAGNDGMIKIWDLCFNSNVVVSIEAQDIILCERYLFSKHCSMSHNTQISWSRFQVVEKLASGVIDRQMKLWSLKVQPHYANISSNFSLVGGTLNNKKTFLRNNKS